jgi:hypothetical protein
MEKFEVPDYDRPERNYLTRWRIVQTPWAAIYLHRMDGPDPRPTLHDHPWRFLSIVLRGGYVERRRDPVDLAVRARTVRHVNVMGLQDAHSIRELLRVPTWTLLLVGPRVRTWGYLEPAGSTAAWRWTEFDKHRHADEFAAALARRKMDATRHRGARP